jgi:hypothetical protein
MGKTVESYRMALEGEISRWNGFARAKLVKLAGMLLQNKVYLFRSSLRLIWDIVEAFSNLLVGSASV